MDIILKYNKNIRTTTYSYYSYNSPIVIDLSTFPCVQDEVKLYAEFNGINFIEINKPNCKKNIVKVALIVESPHKDEFDANFNPRAPLNGKSGQRFSSKILSKLQQWFANSSFAPNTIFEICVINPVQIQTSLYHCLKTIINNVNPNMNNKVKFDRKMRNNVWKFLFNDCQLKNDFNKRILKYNPDYIINCCTGSSIFTTFNSFNTYTNAYRTDLKSFVRDSLIITKVNMNNYLEDKHPAVW